MQKVKQKLMPQKQKALMVFYTNQGSLYIMQVSSLED